jgi:galactokinase
MAQGSTYALDDVSAFLDLLNAPPAEAHGLFRKGAQVVVARAPGRLDVMGGIADYSGSLVLEWPLREAALAALQQRADRMLRILSLGSASFEAPLEELENLDYDAACARFRRDPATQWAAYAAGAFLVLARERGAVFAQGASILIDSQVPQGKGVSSSAAIEVAVMQAVCAAYHIRVEPRELALLCQKVENLVVGAPCGVMDQMTSAGGEPNRLLALLCQPAELQGVVELPDEVAFWGLDSGIRHEISGADYGSVRAGAFMGRRMLAALGGYADHRHLVDTTPSEFEQFYAARIPERLHGAEFLERYGGTADHITEVRPDAVYAVRAPTAHPIYEHSRVRSFAELLGGAVAGRRLELLGELMYQSHASYSACGLGSGGTDLLVQLVRQAGPARGLYGAKITGGGSGGTVCVLGRREAEGAIQSIADQYQAQTGHRPYIFRGSSPGAAAFGHLILEDSE